MLLKFVNLFFISELLEDFQDRLNIFIIIKRSNLNEISEIYRIIIEFGKIISLKSFYLILFSAYHL